MAEGEKTQRAKFVEAAQKAGCKDDESAFDEALKRISRPENMPPMPAPTSKKKNIKRTKG